MRFLLVLTLFILPIFTHAENLVPVDKAAHFGLAFAGQTICGEVGTAITEKPLETEITCLILINAAGALKEAVDAKTGGSPELGDIGANLLGSGLSMGIRLSF